MSEADAEARARILEKAQEFFFTHGYSRVTMDELAAELRMSKKTLYRHFSSKEELGEAAIAASFALIREELTRIIGDEQRDYGERFQSFVKVLAARYARGALVLRDLQRDAPALWQRLLELRRSSVQATFGGLFAQGVKAGALRTDVEPRLVIRMVLTLVDQVMRPDVLGELGMSAEEAFPGMLGVILDGIRTGRETRSRPVEKIRRARA